MTTYLKSLWFAPILLLIVFIAACFSGMQTDEALKTKFTKNRDSFAKLEQLFVNDPTLFGVSSSAFFRRINGRISKTELTDDDRLLFDRMGGFSGSRNDVNGLDFISFPVSVVKLPGGDLSEEFYEQKGYALILAPEEKVHELLGTGKAYGNVEFGQIEQNWYIYQRVVVSKPE